MRNPLKIKILVIGFSILLLFVISLLQNNFYATPTLKKWQKLTWNDFNGISTPFTRFGAAITSDIVIEYNDIDSSFIAYAIQNNQRSWKKEENEDSDYLLNHEQYHFNITEVFARKMNVYIKDNPDKGYQFYNNKLLKLKEEENKMQKDYDENSSHGSSEVDQRIWEYKIDTLLQNYSDDDNSILDKYSGAKVIFPKKPYFKKGIDSFGNYSFRHYVLKTYDMTMLMASFQYLEPKFEDFEGGVKNFYKNKSLELLSFKNISEDNEIRLKVNSKDSINKDIIQNLWIYRDDYIYKLTSRYPLEYNSNSDYTKIADDFINSFEIVSTYEYWKEKFQNSKLDYQYRNLTKSEVADDDCLVYSEESQYVFFKGPIFMENGSFIIIQDIPDKGNKDVKYNFLKLNNDIFTYKKIDTTNHILYVPHEKTPENTFDIEFGYVPNGDMVNECYDFNYQTIKITPPPQKP